MTNTRNSSVLKILMDVSEERKIKTLPAPYSEQLTPYAKNDFSEITKTVCAEQKDVLSSLKICKVIILGDVCVGKTCIVNRFCHKLFESTYKATIGVDFEVEKFEILKTPFNLQIWDTAGQERFKCIAQSYYRCAHAVMVVFDVSNVSSLGHCKSWMKEALMASNTDAHKFIIGTKKDLLSSASYQMVENYASNVANTLNAEYWSVSSKTGENVDKLFRRIAALVFDELIAKSNEGREEINIGSDTVSFRRNSSKNNDKKRGCELKCKSA